MMMPSLVTQAGYRLTNEQFLRAIFGDSYIYAYVTSFLDDPNNIPQDRRGLAWSGGWFQDTKLIPDSNQFYTVSLFALDDDGKARRRKSLFAGCYVVGLDDVLEKLPLEQVNRLPLPSIIIRSSNHSEQRLYILDTPETNQARLDNLHDQLIANGLAPDGNDPGQKGVTRFLRLPEGVNTKAKRIAENDGTPPRCEVIEFHPERRYTMEQLAEPFGVNLDAPRRDTVTSGAADIQDHPVLSQLKIKSILSPGRFDITCPWVDDHTDHDDSGTAVFTNEDLSIGFACHHGHCQDKTGKDLLDHLEEQQSGFREGFDTWKLMREFSAIPGVGVMAPPINFMAPPQSPNEEELYDPEKAKTAKQEMPDIIKMLPTALLCSYHDYVLSCVPHTSDQIAMATVISLAGTVTSRIFVTDKENLSPLFIGVIAPSGFGKNSPKTAINKLLDAAGLEYLIGGSGFTSSNAVRALLEDYPASLVIMDEFGDRLKQGLNPNMNWLATAFSLVKEIYSECHTTSHPPRMAKSNLNGGKSASIRNPCLSLLGISTPAQLHDALDSSSLEGGFINRFVWISAEGDEPTANFHANSTPPAKLITHLKQFEHYRNMSDVGEGSSVDILDGRSLCYKREPKLHNIPFTKESEQLLMAFYHDIIVFAGNDDIKTNLVRRWKENAMRMALALTMLDNPEAKSIPSNITQWCITYVRYHGERFIEDYSNAPDSVFAKQCDALLSVIRQAGKKGVTKKFLGRNKIGRSLNSQQRRDVLAALVDAEQIFEQKEGEGLSRRPTIRYVALK